MSAIHPEGHLTSQSRLCLQFHTWPTANRCNSNFCLFVCLFYSNIFHCFPKSTLGGLQSNPTVKSQTFNSNLNCMVSFHRCFFDLLLEKILSTQRNDFSWENNLLQLSSTVIKEKCQLCNWKNKLVEGSYREKLGLVKFPLYPSICWTTALF